MLIPYVINTPHLLPTTHTLQTKSTHKLMSTVLSTLSFLSSSFQSSNITHSPSPGLLNCCHAEVTATPIASLLYTLYKSLQHTATTAYDLLTSHLIAPDRIGSGETHDETSLSEKPLFSNGCYIIDVWQSLPSNGKTF
jgi:hypothetical protein